MCCIVFAIACNTLEGQSHLLRRADRNLKHENYKRAYHLYHKFWQKNQNNEVAIRHLAQISDIRRDYRNAEAWYKKMIELGVANNDDVYMCLKMMHRNENYKQADQLRKVHKKNNELLSDKYFWTIDTISFLKRKDKNGDIHIIKKINTSSSEIAPVFYPDNRLLFLSDRVKCNSTHRRHKVSDNSYYSLYSIPHNKVGYTLGDRPELFNPVTNTRFNTGSVCFNADGTEMFFTRNERSDKKNSKVFYLQLYSSLLLSDGTWSKAKRLSFNENNSSIAHVSLSDDGNKLYFSSDRAGGYGGSDIYVISRDRGSWGQVRNLGERVNTIDDEAYPFISNKQVLVFASQGHAGFGGYDLFSIDLADNKAGVVNLGRVLNSSDDDFAMVVDKSQRQGYFTSNRKGSDDIYYLYLLEAINSKTVPEVDPVEFNPPSYMGKLLKLNDDLVQTFELENIYYQFNSDLITPESLGVLDTIASILNQNIDIHILIRSHTDSRGSALYNKKLSERRAKAAVDYLRKRIVEPFRVTGVGCGEEELLNRCKSGVDCSEEEHKVNRRSEFVIVRVNEQDKLLGNDDIKLNKTETNSTIKTIANDGKGIGKYTIVVGSSKTMQGIDQFAQVLINDKGIDAHDLSVSWFNDVESYRILYKSFGQLSEANVEIKKINIGDAWILPL